MIPQKNVEVILSMPLYLVHNEPSVQDEFSDFQALIKHRFAARDEEHGNYILTAFLAVSASTGQYKNGALNPIITPTISYGKGSRNFDVQGTYGVAMLTGNTKTVGRSFVWNDEFQCRIFRKF